jgi:hypothetical protein
LDNVPDALKQLDKSMKAGDAKALRKHVFSGNTISSMAGIVQRGGARSLRSFLKGHTNARYHQLQILAITAYLEWESACGKSLDILSGEYPEATPEEAASATENLEVLECAGRGLTGRNNRRELYQMYARGFVDTLSGEYDEEDPDADLNHYSVGAFGHGALFHMAQIAQHQLLHHAGGPPIKAIEGDRRIWLYKDDGALDKHFEETNFSIAKPDLQNSYVRKVDIILGEVNGPEQWIELKSYKAISENAADRTYLDVLYQVQPRKKRTIPRWSFTDTQKRATKNKGKGLHRQFSIDRAAANVGHARLAYDGDRENPLVSVSSDFTWYFRNHSAQITKNNT